MADRLRRYREKRDPAATPEPAGAEGAAGGGRSAALRRPGAPRAPPALGPAARARRRARLLGRAARASRPPGPQQPRGAHGGPSARVPRVPRRDPRRPVRRGHDDDLGPRHLRAAQVARRRGDDHLPRRAAARPPRAVPDARRRLDDPPDGPAGGPGSGADARAARADARHDGPAAARRRALGVRDQVGRRARDRLRRRRPAAAHARSGRDITSRYPELRPLGRGARRPRGRAGRRGGGVRETGRPSFQKLQGRMHLASETASAASRAPIPSTT